VSSRRRFLQAAVGAGAAFASFGSLSLLTGCAPSAATRTGLRDITLRPMLDPTSGQALIQLPPGFRYFSFATAGDSITGKANGSAQIPGAADGMGIVKYEGSSVRLIRNHELWEDTGCFARPDWAYDEAGAGGTLTLDVDLQSGKLRQAEVSLCGTTANCSGGVTPWGTWLSGEEQVSLTQAPIKSRSGRLMDSFSQPHGFMFESGVRQNGRFAPILGMGQMRHEAAAFDTQTGYVYLTEDNEPSAGLYRYRPLKPTDLHAGGTLEMLVAEGRTEFRNGVPSNQAFKTRWVVIADPLRAHANGGTGSDGCFQQGAAQGGAHFRRVEGIYVRNRELFFTATNGGDAALGQVFSLGLDSTMLSLVYEATDAQVMNWPDAIEKGPSGGHIICQDGKELFPQVLYYLSPEGKVAPIARNNMEGGQSKSEWAGCSMSADGRWLFANIYSPGLSVAITGPFEQWAEAVKSA